MQAIANRLAGFVVANDKDANYEILAYGLGLVVTAIVVNIVIIASAFLLGLLMEMLIVMVVSSLMSLIIGGVHAKTRGICFVLHVGVLYLCIFLAFVLNFSSIAIAALYIVNVILLLLYAPADTVQQPIVKGRLVRKVLGLGFMTLFFTIAILIGHNMPVEANLLLLMSTATCLLMHPAFYWMFGCKKSSYGS